MIKSWQLILLLILLVALFGILLGKMSIYLDSYFDISKRTNADKQRYIENSSFFRNNYKNFNITSYININIETLFIIVLFLLTAWGIICNKKKWITYSQFDCYYWGDTVEYNFVDYFVKMIIILTLTIGVASIFWFHYYKQGDNDLEESEKVLKTHILDNIDYEFLAKKSADNNYNIDAYLNEYVNQLQDMLNIFKLGFTYDIMTSLKFRMLKKDLEKWSKEEYGDNKIILDVAILTKIKDKIKENINNTNYYLIANYNHNKDTPIPILNILLHNILINIKASTDAQKTNRTRVQAIIDFYINSPYSPQITEIVERYDNVAKYFKETIRIYKGIYDKYYTYYIYNILITKSLIVYVLLIIIYIFVKITKRIDFYTLKTGFYKYGIVLLTLYYSFITPLILFGFT
jgi:hypothetical protein